MSAPDNPRAFPKTLDADQLKRQEPSQPGMTLRDWFAGQALTGIIAGADTEAAFLMATDEAPPLAYRLADAMLAERAKGGRP